MDKLRDDIERYLGGKMTPAERHGLEKRALSDPFLADALEGAESLTENKFSLDVSELNQKLVGTSKSRWLWPLRIAASVVGIALISMVVIFSMRDNEATLANNEKKTESKSEEKTTQPTDTTSSIESEKSGEQEQNLIATTEAPKKSKPAETKPVLASRRENQLASTGGAGIKKTGPVVFVADTLAAGGLMAATVAMDTISIGELADVAMEETSKTDFVLSSPPTSQPTVVENESKDDVVKKERTKGIVRNRVTVTGQVRDQQGQPLPGATINIKGKVVGTVTDADGKYSLTLPDSSATLQYLFIGFVPQEMKVNKLNDYADVQLMEDATQLSEVVVTGYGEKKADGEPLVRLAEPVGGMKAYDKYLEDKKIYPQQALDSKVEGKVVIEFTVGITGTISDFTVIKKIGFGCEEEVIRLVKEGPGWHPSYIDNEAVESLVRIKTRFDLPDKK